MDWKNPKLLVAVLLVVCGAVLYHEAVDHAKAPLAAIADDPDSPYHLLPADKQPVLPDWTLTDVSGQKRQLSSFLKNGPVILDFWATYCGPCRQELPELDAIRQNYASKGVQVFAVNGNDDAATISQFAIDNKVGIPMVVDTNGTMEGALRIDSIPVTLVIDTDRKLKTACVGYDPDMKVNLPRALDIVLQEHNVASTDSETAKG